jgi:tRNA (mo5U34)-methyltransferase
MMSQPEQGFPLAPSGDASLAPGLRDEIERGGWMYDWRLTATIATPTLGPNLASVHKTREEMIEPVVRAALASTGPEPLALDLACNEGWFSHRLLQWGAHRVVGIDVREENIRRATLLQDHFRVPADRLTFTTADVFALDAEKLGVFDVVLMLGLIYHLERPLEAIRIARRLTRGVCVIESQLTRQDRPIVRGDGVPNVYFQTPASFAALVEAESSDSLISSTAGTMSLVPNRAALEAMPRWAGFERVSFLSPQAHHDVQYVRGDRAIVAAYADAHT